MKMFKFSFFLLVCMVMAMSGYAGVFQQNGAAFAADDEIPDIYFVPDVRAQFAALAQRADALGFAIATSPGPTDTTHYQGIARSHGPGTPYFFVTRSNSGNPANLLVVEMGSRDANGERLRSNRLLRGKDTHETPPDSRDTAVEWFYFNGQNGWPHYDHAGGMQLVGDVLAIALEGPLGSETREDIVVFLDVSTPKAPTVLGDFDINPPGTAAALVGLTKTLDSTYLMLVTGKNNDSVWIFESTSLDFDDAAFGWNYLDEWSESDDESYLGASWPSDLCSPSDWDCDHPHQTLHFVREGSVDGDLYLIGTRNKSGGGPFDDDDYFDLYKVEWCNDDRTICQTEPGAGLQFTLRHIQTRHISTKSTSESEEVANFAAAGGVYISPSGEIIIYGTEHTNDGPKDAAGRETVRAGEWRHHDMVRPDSPTYLPTAATGGPFEVPEGGSVTLEGSGKPAITWAWIELFEDSDWGGRSLVIDMDDWDEENFDNFNNHDFGFSNEASSWRWFAPATCTLRVNDFEYYADDFPGDDTKTLYGNGQLNTAEHLILVQNDSNDNDMNDQANSMQFFPNCEDYYYNQSIELWWDFDEDDVYETPGATPVFSAAGLDGPDAVTVGLKAMHPSDGTNGIDETTIQITNVPPEIETFAVVDEMGREIGVDIPIAMIGLGLDLAATFTDPGIPDTHTATVDWADGTVVDLGPVVATVNASHTYTAAGSYTITLTVTDDDGGIDIETRQIEVASAKDAIRIVVEMLKQLPASHNIAAAIAALEGNNGGRANNGALDELEKGNLNAALQKIKQSLLYLDKAAAADPSLDLAPLQGLLALSAKAIVIDAIAKAESVATKQNEQRKLAEALKLVEKGDDLLADGNYVGAVLEYQKAQRSIQGI